MSEARRSSILKPPKQRAPLQDVNSLNTHIQDDFTSTTVTQNILRRVSFAGVSTVKEFDAQAESVLVCHTPAYEESFATSDSSVPSDHSSRFSSRSTISVEDQSTLPTSLGDIHQNVDPDDLIFMEFGVATSSQPSTKSPRRNARFSITAPSNKEESPKMEGKPAAAAISSVSFYGKQSPKPRMSGVPSPSTRSQRLLTIDPFSLRPKPSKVVNSPKSQSRRKSLQGALAPLPSPKGKSPLGRWDGRRNPNDSSSSEMDLTEAISGSIFVNTPSPSSVASQETTASISVQQRPDNGNRTVVDCEDMDFTRINPPTTPGGRNKTIYEKDMDLTRSAAPTKILEEPSPSDGSVHCAFRNSVEFPQSVSGVAIRNEQHFVTERNSSVICVSNSVVTGLPRPLNSAATSNEMSLYRATVSTPQDMELTKVIPDMKTCFESGHARSELGTKSTNTTIYEAAMSVTEAFPAVQVLTDIVALNTTVAEQQAMNFIHVLPSGTVSHKDLSGNNGNPDSVRFRRRDSKVMNKTVSDPVGMEFTEVVSSVPVLPKDLSKNEGMPSESLRFNARDLKAVNSTICNPEGMELTRVIPSMPELSESKDSPEPLYAESANQTLNDSIGMDLTEAIPFVPELQKNYYPATNETDSLLTVDHGVKTANKTVNDSMRMDFTEAVPSAPLVQTPGFGKSFCGETSNKSLSDSKGIEFMEAIPSAPPLQDYHFSENILNSHDPVAHKTLCDSMDMELTRAVSAKLCYDFSRNIRGASDFGVPTIRSNTTLYDSTGMEFTKVSPVPLLLNSSRVNENSKLSSTGKTTDSAEPIYSSVHTTADVVVRNSVTPGGSLQTSIHGSQSTQQTENLTCSMGRIHQQNPNYTPATVQETDQLVTQHSDVESGLPRTTDIRTSPPSLTQETNLPVTDVHVEASVSRSRDTRTSPTVQETDQLVTQHSDVESGLSRTTDIRTSPPSLTQETNLPVTDVHVEASVSRSRDTRTSPTVQETVELVTDRETITIDSTVSLQETSPLIAHTSNKQVCRKRSFDEVDNNGQEAMTSNKSRFLTSPLVPASEIVIPSSRSPSPLEHDSSTRFPGLCQSFQGIKAATPQKPPVTDDFALPSSLVKKSSPSPTNTVPRNDVSCSTDMASLVAGEAINVVPPVSTDEQVSSSCERQRLHLPENPVQVMTQPANVSESVSKPMDVETDCVLKALEESHLTNKASDERKSFGRAKFDFSFEADKLLHKSIMDASLPSITEVSDCCVERDVSSNARLYATLLAAENNVSVFHKEHEFTTEESALVNVPRCGDGESEALSEEEQRTDDPFHQIMSVCEEIRSKEQKEEETGYGGNQSRASDKIRAVERSDPRSLLQSGISNESQLDRTRNQFSRSLMNITGTSHTDLMVCRLAEEIINVHRKEYRKRKRCNWTAQKVVGREWCFNYLEDSLELRIKVEESSKSELLSGHDGRFVSLIDDSLHGVWYIGGRLLFQKLSSEEWASRIHKTSDVLRLVEEVNLVANDVEVFMTQLVDLVMTKNIDITHNWVRFNVLSRKSRDRWFKVKVDCRDIINIQPSHVTIENVVGETRETDIQNLVTCVKKNAFFLKNYIAVVEEYLETIQRTR